MNEKELQAIADSLGCEVERIESALRWSRVIGKRADDRGRTWEDVFQDWVVRQLGGNNRRRRLSSPLPKLEATPGAKALVRIATRSKLDSKVLRTIARGYPLKMVARKCGVHPQTVRRALRRVRFNCFLMLFSKESLNHDSIAIYAKTDRIFRTIQSAKRARNGLHIARYTWKANCENRHARIKVNAKRAAAKRATIDRTYRQWENRKLWFNYIQARENQEHCKTKEERQAANRAAFRSYFGEDPETRQPNSLGACYLQER